MESGAQLLTRRSLRALAAIAAALVVAGSATAAVVSVTGEDSKPLTGTLPGRGERYRVALSPNLAAGQIGWCTTIVVRPGATGRGCGPAPPADAPLIAGGGLFSPDRGVVWAVVDRRVAAMRLSDGRRIVTSASPAVPEGWRVAVAFTKGGEPRWTPLDAAGRALSTRPNDRAGTEQAGTATLATRAVDPRDPPRGRCAIRVGRSLRAVSERVVTRLPARAPDVGGRPFLSCASAVVYLGRFRYTAAVLVDARRPARRAAPLAAPGADLITARRHGPGWLAVRGEGAAHRRAVLRALR
jgi:hypothetical protein